MQNYIFASVYANWKGFNVSIIEVDHLNNNGKFLLHSSIDSDRLSIEDIAAHISPIIPSDAREKRFIGVYFNQIRSVAEGVWGLLKCKGGYLAPPRDVGTSLCNISLKINSGELLVSNVLSGVLHSDIQRTKPDDIPLRIASLVQVSDFWNGMKFGAGQDKPLEILARGGRCI